MGNKRAQDTAAQSTRTAPDITGYNMTILSATPQNGPDTATYRLGCLRALLGHEPPALASRALLAGDMGMLLHLLGDDNDALDALPSAWWMTAHTQRPGAILFTGFEPFGGHAVNPSWAAAEAAADAARSPILDAQSVQLPVTFKVACDAPAALLTEIPPTHAALLVHIGLAADRDTICLERYAHNTRGQTADNDGLIGRGVAPYDQLEPGGPSARETLLPLDLLREVMRDAGAPLPARVTRDPGDYVCNAVYYAALDEVSRRRAQGGAAEALFVHIPMVSQAHAASIGAALGQTLAAWLTGTLWS
jgi:pyroglutamyl-peptidase